MNITNMEIAQATIEIFGGFVCLMSTLIIGLNSGTKKSLRHLGRLFLVAAFILFAEALAYIFRGNTDVLSVIMTRISNMVVFFCNYLLADFVIRYICKLLEEKDVQPSIWYIRFADFSVLVCVLGLLVNCVTGWMYFFDMANYYHRNTGWYFYFVWVTVCLLVACFLSVKYRKVIGMSSMVSILLCVAIPTVATIVQAFWYGFSIVNMGIGLGILVMLVGYLIDSSKEIHGNVEIQKRNRKSAEVIILFIIMVISMSASIISCILSIQRISDENSESNSQIIAHMVNDRIENECLRPIMVSRTISQDINLRKLLKESGSVSAESVESQVAAYLASIRDGFGYQMVFAASEDSRAYFTYDGICKYLDVVNDAHDIWYQEYCESGKPYVLNVDTDEANDWSLSVFVNTGIRDASGELLGVCGAGVEMTRLQEVLAEFEEKYDIRVILTNENGLTQVDAKGENIEKAYWDNTYFTKVGADDFYYENRADSSRLTKYLEDLGWYLVVIDYNPNKINVKEITFPSIVIFLMGLLVMGIVFALMSVAEQKIAAELLEKNRISLTDELTGAYNRRAYEEKCAEIQAGADLSKIAVIMLDINGLKAANDNLGHAAGDELIIGAANCMKNTFSEYGWVYRTGGDEFVVLLQCSRARLDDLIKTYDHVTDTWKGVQNDSLSTSKGVVACGEHGDLTFAEMLELADKRMYEDKDAYYLRTGKVRRTI